MDSSYKYKLSIIVPIYNVEKYLRRAIDSLLAQTLDGIQIILVNDGSPDGSGKIIDEYAERCSWCSALHKKNGGLSDARNAGLKIAQGEYVGFVDPDDYVEPDMFEKLYKAVKQNDSDLGICGYFEEFSKNYVVEQTIQLKNANTTGKDAAVSFLEGKYGAYAWNKLFKKSIIDANELQFPVGIMLSEDTVFFSDYLKYTKTVSVVEQCLYHYIRNGDSICAKYHKMQYEYYLAGNDAKESLIRSLEADQQVDCSKLKEENSIGFLATCLNVLDQMYSVGNKASNREKFSELIRICNREKVQSLIDLYSEQIRDEELRKKIILIQAGKWNRLHIHEIWKMRVIGKIKYYIG